MARWGVEANDNAQFVVQPWDLAGYLYRFDTALQSDYSTHAFDWAADGVQLSSHQGHGVPPGEEIASWVYAGTDVPPEGQGNAGINLWLYGGTPPSDGQEAEVIIEAFDYEPPPAPPFVDQVATGQLCGARTVNGSYTNTHANDGTAQAITERESGGKPTKRDSYPKHTWLFDVQAGSTVTFKSRAWAPPSSLGDAFAFAWLVDGTSWTEMFTVTATSENDNCLPPSASGVVSVCVTDTNRSPGHRNLDTIHVEHAFIRTELVPGDPPAAPTDLAATAVSASQVDLIWIDHATNETSFKVERSPNGVGDWALAGTTCFYRVQAFSGSSASGYSNVASAMTELPGASHVGDLEGLSSLAKRSRWAATVLVTVHDNNENLLAGATVHGTWGGGATGESTCDSDGNGQCQVTEGNLKSSVGSVTFTVTDVTLSGYTCDPAANHDPAAATISVYRPQ